MLNFIACLALTFSPPDSLLYKAHLGLSNSSGVEVVEGDSVLLTLKKSSTEVMYRRGYEISDSDGLPSQMTIWKLDLKQRKFNIFGIQILRIKCTVESSICIGTGCFDGTGKDGILTIVSKSKGERIGPLLTRKVFLEALQKSLEESTEFNPQKNPK